MAWLIIRIEPVENEGTRERNKCPIVETLTKRAQLRQATMREMVDLLAAHGYEMAPLVGPHPKDIETYRFMGYAYTSKRKDGYGRAASTLYRLLVRRTS